MARNMLFDEKLRSACHQSLGIEPRREQMQAAHWLQQRTIVEMETGEGKTLAVAMAAIQHATQGHRTFIATANDYLASRDASEMSPFLECFGLKASALCASQAQEARCRTYSADIVYGTVRELGFDTLRDALRRRKNHRTERPWVPTFHTIIVDEADSVLIDDALTPLVISEPASIISSAKASLYQWCASQAREMIKGSDYLIHSANDQIALTDQGIAKVIHQPMPISLEQYQTIDILHAVERAIDVDTRVKRNVHYLVRGDQIVLIDEPTGRLAESKQMGGGFHQAIEAKENLAISVPGSTAARMTIQELANRVTHLCGVTATATEEKRELSSVYRLRTKRIRRHQASRRDMLCPLTFRHEQDKLNSVVTECQSMLLSGRPILIGTRTIEKSEVLATMLRAAGISPRVLNARQTQEEASIIALAGQSGQVTVATNMAGRGTDIRLSEEARRSGGLHVIIAEPHALARLDRQLAGRCGRQGDPGSVRRFFSSDDAIFEMVGGIDKPHGLVNRLSGVFTGSYLVTKTAQAQRLASRIQRLQRRQLAEADSRLADDLIELGLDPHLDRLELID